MGVPDYYGILQVTPGAEPEVIAAAYKRLAFKYHPDRNDDPAAQDRMRELNEAYETLGDPDRRRQYDAAMEPQSPKPADSNSSPRLLDPLDWILDWIGDRLPARLSRVWFFLFASGKWRGRDGERIQPLSPAPSQSLGSFTAALWRAAWSGVWSGIRQTLILALVIGLIGGIFIVSRLRAHRNERGERIEVGKCTVYFTEGVEKGLAQKLGGLLMRSEFHNDDTVQVRRDSNGRYELRFIYKNTGKLDSDTRSAIEELGRTTSKECFSASPVDIHFCDADFKSWEIVPFQPEPPIIVLGSASWDTGIFSHDLLLANQQTNLQEIRCFVTLYLENGGIKTVERYWPTWGGYETKKITGLDATKYPKVIVEGTAMRGPQKVRINSSYTWNWR